MSAVRTAIELQDNFTGILYQVINSVNMGLSAMEDLHQTMNAPVDTASIEAARDSINQATIAVQQLDAAMQGIETPETQTPTAPQSSTPVVLPVQPDVPDPLVGQPPPVDVPIQPEQPEPVEVPVHWQSESLEVFTNSGVERFEQEVQSANNMLNTLNQTQSRIAATAAQTDLFPASAVSDMNNMQNRLQAIQQRIQTIESNPLNMGSDTVNTELEQLRGQLVQAVQEQQNLNRAVDNMDVQAANEAYLRLSQAIGGTERYIRDNVDEQGRFNREIEEGTNEANELMRTIKGAVAAYATIQTLSAALNLSDQLTSATARLNLMNDGLQTTQDLQNMIFLSAERARGNYQATANAVSKLGLMAGDAFGSSEEIIAFMEQVNKQFTIAGTEAAGIDAAMLQLTQAMGSGVLRGEEYNSILEQAPNIIQAIADYMEVPKGQLKDMAAEGQITADIVKAAMFAAADETNAKFESMPKTFSQIWTSFQNTAFMAFQPVLQRLNEIANSEAFQEFVNSAIEGLSVVAGITLEIFDLLASAAGAVADNWSWLSPIIYGVVGALAVYYGSQVIANTISAISKGIHVAMAVAQMVHAAATGILTSATAAEIAAQNGLNEALLACPIMWIVILIIALIALFYAAVGAINKFAGTSISATGVICGAFMVGAAFIGNLFVALINFVIDIFAVLWNFIAAFINFFANVFTDPVGAIARLFFDLVDTVLSLLQSLANAIDTIFGSNLAGSVQGWRDSLGGWVDSTFGKGEEVMEKVDPKAMHLGRFEYGSAWDAGYKFGQGIDESIANFDPASLFDTNIPDAGNYADLSNYGGAINNIGNGVDDISGNTGKIANSMEISREELKYLHDIAERDVVNRYTTASIKVDMVNNNTINSEMDLDGVTEHLRTTIEEQMYATSEGVH
ncbi:tape measure protein [Lachnospiraceae bacterium 46-15]